MKTAWKKATRKANFTVHLWIGLILSVYVAAIGITGAILSFKEPIMAAQHPNLLRVVPGPQRASLAMAIAEVRQAHPTEPISGLSLSEKVDKSLLVISQAGKQTRYNFVNPYTGAYLGDYIYDGSSIWWVYELHTNLLFKETGGKVNGILSMFAVALFSTGLYLWWPATRQQLKLRLTVKRGVSAKRTTHDLHNVFGVYALPILIVTFLTGTAFAYYEPFEKVVSHLAGLPAESEPLKVVDAPYVRSLDELMQAARTRVPQGNVTYIAVSGAPTAPTTLYFDMPDMAQFGHRVQVTLDPHTSAILRVEDTHQNRVKGIFETLLSWHFGTWGGLFSHALYALCSLSLLGLSVTGWLKYLHKRKGYAANRAKREEQVKIGASLTITEKPAETIAAG